ncbi:transporter substrate-binding domain-containing protein [Sulfitobacter sp. D35]|uniref:transporter substrate-binding domain-containing protein n=1 Tax=Sulfitobacter sp. D35 TaxID=3083252 RepID=UPI00296EFBC2|nr:transporter substrate-binding domain-containing protein [Sulfitobacter sp. D35]MDW4497083.1 transporter substrate-binding domain-containing protein [Sulfitobacter sp. D35]
MSRPFLRICVALFSFWTLHGTAALAQSCIESRPDADIVVAIRDSPPFSSFDEDGVATGFSVRVWEKVARRLWKDLDAPPSARDIAAMSFEERKPLLRSVAYVSCETIDQQEAAMAQGLIDVVISPLTITAERMERYDFSQQFLSSGLTLALPHSNAIDFADATEVLIETVTQPGVVRAVVIFLTFNLIMAYLLRAALVVPEDEPSRGKVSSGMRYMLEATMRSIGVRGVDEAYYTNLSKVLEIFLAVVGTALSATILGVLTSAFVGSIGTHRAVDPRALTSMRIATLDCSTSQEFLREQYAALDPYFAEDDPARDAYEARLGHLACPRMEPTDTAATDVALPGEVVLTKRWVDAMHMLANGRVDGVLGDWVALTYLSRTDLFAGQVTVQPSVYRNEPYGWGIARKEGATELRAAIDRGLIAQMRDIDWRKNLEAELGAGAVSPN